MGNLFPRKKVAIVSREIRKEDTKKVFSFFILAFPTILIVILNRITPSAWWAGTLLAFYQLIMLKQFIDSHYDYGGSDE